MNNQADKMIVDRQTVEKILAAVGVPAFEFNEHWLGTLRQGYIIRTQRDLRPETRAAISQLIGPTQFMLDPQMTLDFNDACHKSAPDKDAEPSPVAHPKHYNTGKIEVIEFLEDQQLEPHEWNTVKYVCRAKHKGKRIEDLEKAVWYLQRKIEILKAEVTGRAPARPNDMRPRQ